MWCLLVDYFQNYNIYGVLRHDSAVLGVLQRATSTTTMEDDEAGEKCSSKYPG